MRRYVEIVRIHFFYDYQTIDRPFFLVDGFWFADMKLVFLLGGKKNCRFLDMFTKRWESRFVFFAIGPKKRDHNKKNIMIQFERKCA